MGLAKEIFSESIPIDGGGHLDVGLDKRGPDDQAAVDEVDGVKPLDIEKLKKLAAKNPEPAGILMPADEAGS